LSKGGLALREGIAAAVVPIQIEKIEGENTRLAAAKQQIIETRRPFRSTQAISHPESLLLRAGCQREMGAKDPERRKLVAIARNQASSAFQVCQYSEAGMLQLEIHSAPSNGHGFATTAKG
jgi:hypothetical protein